MPRSAFARLALPLLLALFLFALPVRSPAATPMAAIPGVGTPPVVTSATYLAWLAKYEAFRVHENDGPRARHYYVSTAGSDANSGLDPVHPWATLAKANTALTVASTEVSLRYGDTWHEWLTVPYTGLTQGIQVTTLYTITSPPTDEIWPGQTLSFTGGTAETLTVLSYNSATGVVQIAGTVGAGHTALSNGQVTWPITATATGSVSTLTFGTLPASPGAGAILPGLAAGTMTDVPSEGYRQIGSYNQGAGVLTLTSLLDGTGRTAFNLHIPSYLLIPSGVNGCEIDAYSDGTAGHTPFAPAPTLSAWGFNVAAGVYSATPAYAWRLAQAGSGDAGTSVKTYVDTYYGYGSVPTCYAGAFRATGATGPDSGIRPVASYAECEATPGSWYADNAAIRLYFHPLNPGVAPNASGIGYEFCGQNATTGIVVGDCDGTRLAHVHVTGYGLAAPGQKVVPGYAVELDLGAANHSAVLDAVETDYSSRHAIGNISGGAGAILTVNNCRVGWLTGDTGLVVNYNAGGGQETLVVNPVYLAGKLGAGQYGPYGSYSTQATGGPGSFCHTAGGSASIGWFVSAGARNVAGQWQTGGMDGPSSNAPAWTDPAQCRSFVVGQDSEAREPTPLDLSLANTQVQGGGATTSGLSVVGSGGGIPYTVYVGCRTMSRILNFTSDYAYYYDASDTGGLWINSVRRFSDVGAPPRLQILGRYMLGGPGSAPPYAKYYNCALEWEDAGPEEDGVYQTIGEGSSAVGNVVMCNCVFSQVTPGPQSYFSPALGNDPSVQSGNAYAVFNPPPAAGAAAGFSAETGAVALGPWGAARPDLASPLLAGPAVLVGGLYRLEYDIAGALRSASQPAIGPYSYVSGALPLVAIPVIEFRRGW